MFQVSWFKVHLVLSSNELIFVTNLMTDVIKSLARIRMVAEWCSRYAVSQTQGLLLNPELWLLSVSHVCMDPSGGFSFFPPYKCECVYPRTLSRV